MDISQSDSGRSRTISIIEVVLILFFACIPLFAKFPYRVNIFLSWEGAYRLSRGEVPYKDFGMPLGYMYWVVPALFFKIFGTQMITLVKAQVFLNIISGFAFRSILRSLGVQPVIRVLSVLLFCISYIFFNFWPWYNQTVIVYEIVALAFLFRFLFADRNRWSWIYLVLSALFTFCSFFTKQDAGGLAFFLCLALLFYESLTSRKWLALFIYIGSFVVIGCLFIVPLLQYNFGYWFNHGQPPHTSRVDVADILDEFFFSSQWIKFYLFMVVLLATLSVKSFRELFSNRRLSVFLLLTLGILAEASILQVTSYTPPDNNIFFHSFAFAFIFSLLAQKLQINFNNRVLVFICTAGVVIWWSGSGWKYFQKITRKFTTAGTITTNANGENVVNRKTYKIDPNSATDIPMNKWVFSDLPVFRNIYLPQSTVDGIRRLQNMPLLKSRGMLHVLNMSELTPLAAALPYEPEKGLNQPLWYHLGVAMFNREAAMFEQRIMQHQYDLVLFEYIPSLNNFYPFRVRDSLKVYYQKVDSFAAPRGGDTPGIIEVYTK